MKRTSFLQVIFIFGAILPCMWFSYSWKLMPNWSSHDHSHSCILKSPNMKENICLFFSKSWIVQFVTVPIYVYGSTHMNGPVNRKVIFWGSCCFVLYLYLKSSRMEFKSVKKAFMCCGFENRNTTNGRYQPQTVDLSQSAFRLAVPKLPSHLNFPGSTPV